MERKIGEIFEVEGQWYQCVESKQDACTDCAFNPINGIGYNCSGSCTYKQVIFKKLEKVGEPYYNYEKKLCQQYKCYINPLVTDEIVYVFADNKVVIEIKQNKEDMEEKKVMIGELAYKYINGKITYKEFEKGIRELYEKHSNSEKFGKNLRPFDLQKAREGKPVYTRDGRKARIVCFDRKDNAPIIALIERVDGIEILQCYHNDGKCFHDETSNNDLMMLPEKKEGWVNIVRGSDGRPHMGRGIFQSKEEAENAIKAFSDNLIDTVKICWEE